MLQVINSTPYFRFSIFALFSIISLSLLFPSQAFGSGETSLKFLFAIDRFSEDRPFSDPQGVFFDKVNREIYIADTGNHEIDVFDSQGFPLFQMGISSGIESPLDLMVDKEGRVYVSQLGKAYLEVFDLRGRPIARIVLPEGITDTFSPGRFSMDGEGDFYVIDRSSQQVLVFDPGGRLKMKFGGAGDKEGKFKQISGLALDDKGRIYVSDSLQTPVQVFSREGQFLLGFGRHSPESKDFSFPSGINVDGEGRVWVVDAFRHQLKVFDERGSFLFQFGEYGLREGQLFFPVDIDFDGQGRVYVLEKGGRRLQVFQIEGAKGD